MIYRDRVRLMIHCRSFLFHWHLIDAFEVDLDVSAFAYNNRFQRTNVCECKTVVARHFQAL